MEDRLIAYRRRKERIQEYKDTAAQSCYSLIIVVAALVLLRPVMVDQILGLAGAYAGAGMFDESLRQCDKALLLDGDNGGAWRQSARIHKTRGEREMAYGAYQKAVQADPLDRPTRLELAAMYMDDGRHPLAIPHLEQVRRLGPDNAAGYGPARTSCHRACLDMLVLCYEKVGDPATADTVLKEGRIFYPDYDKTQAQAAPPGENSAGGS